MSKKRVLLAVLSAVLLIILMGVIFYLSNQPADESSELSDSLISKIFELIGVVIPVKVIRKTAHASEFCLLAFLFSNSFALLKSKKWYLFSLAITFVYACSDEIHQLFVEGRAGRFSDVLIDTAGAIIGIAMYFIFLKIIHSVRRKKDVPDTSV